MQVFYIPGLSDKTSVLDPGASHHCIRVLRLGVGQTIQLTDGKGRHAIAEITVPDPKQCRVRIIRECLEYNRRPYQLHIAIAPVKSADRFEWFLEKATEIGIDRITPLLCARSERKSVKMDRSRKILETAMKQSGRAYLPELNGIQQFREFIELHQNGNLYIAHCSARQSQHLFKVIQPGENSLVLIGPEGDFTEEEIGLAKSNNAREVSLGNARFRTETAAITVCQIFSLKNL